MPPQYKCVFRVCLCPPQTSLEETETEESPTEEEGVRKRIRAKTERQEVGDKDPNKTRTETGEGGQSLREKGRERSGIKTFWIKPRVPFL